jgi:K+-sensing histidine kinase KdpD
MKNILVCVTQQKTCERLIIKAVALRNEFKGEIFVIHVAKDGLNFLDNPKEGEALQYLFEISKSIGADLSVLKSDNIIKCIADFAKEKEINCIVLGESPQDKVDNVFYKKLKSMLGDNIDIMVVP